MKTRMFYSMLLLILFSNTLVSFEITNTNVGNELSRPGFVSSSDLSAYTEHDVIVIRNNSDFETQGWPGTGTEGDPYTIEDLLIATSESDTMCIDIRDTTAHFVIRNCFLYGEHGQWDFGLHIWDSFNGIIEDCTITENGIYLRDSDNMTITNNLIYQTAAEGLLVVRGRYLNITSNIVHGCRSGMHINSRGGGRQTHVDSFITIFDNTIYGCDSTSYQSDGLSLSDADFVKIQNNTIYGNKGLGAHGVWLDSNAQEIQLTYNKIGWNLGTNTFDYEGIANDNNWTANWYSNYDSELGYYSISGSGNSDHNASLWTHNESPTVNQPSDLQFNYGTEGHIVEWEPSDSLPCTYQLYIEGELFHEDSWGLGAEKISITVDKLIPGTYEMDLYVSNGANATVMDVVNVIVGPQMHNLAWGVEENTTLMFDFSTSLEIEGKTKAFDDILAMNITDLPEIPDYILYIPTASYVDYWPYNETLAPLSYYFTGGGAVHAIITPAIPTGNWTLYSDLLHEVYDPITDSPSLNMTILDEPGTWGVSFEYLYGDAQIQTHSKWYKTDGSLQEISLVIVNPDVGGGFVKITRMNPPLGTLDPMAIVIFAGVGIGIIAVVVILMKKRQPI